MSGFRSGDHHGFDGSGKRDVKNAVVSDIKASPERGKKRIIARERTSCGQAIAIDIPIREARNIERKESYAFQVEEKSEDRYGGSVREKKTGFKTYYCDEEPEKYSGGGKPAYKSFDSSSRFSNRTKF